MKITTEIILGEMQLDLIEFNYICPECDEIAFADPYFFEVNGSPYCGDCDEVMTVMSATIKVEMEDQRR